MARSLVFVLSVVLAGCGAKTDLRDFSRPAAADGGRRDAGPDRRDGGGPVDAGLDAPILCPECDDGLFCNGPERCDPGTGACLPPLGPPDCSDGVECTVDSCDPTTDACAHVAVDRDEDGDGFSACEGDCDDTRAEVNPGAPEICDGVDNDCDGSIDDGVLSECRDCRPGCHRTTAPSETTRTWMPTEDNSAGVEVDPSGTLSLSTTRTETHFAWIANYLFGTITKLDTRDGTQSAEYDSVLIAPTNHSAPAGQECEVERRGGNCPSRTAVDLRGNLYVANRAFFGQGTITKIAGFPEDCIDRDGDGTIETSGDRDGDGVIERTVRGEFLGQMDECILWTVDVGIVDGVPRALAIAADGTIWVGLHNAQSAVQLDPGDGRVLRTVSLRRDTFSPYGAAIDSRGTLWLVEAGTGAILGVDTATGTVTTRRRTAISRDGCSGSYGIAVDQNDRVWIAGLQCPFAFRYDPPVDRWFPVSIPDSGAPRGIAADDRGRIYVASSHTFLRIGPGGFAFGDPIARLTVFNADDGRMIRVFGTEDEPLPGRGSIGVGLDSRRRAWIINQDSSSATMIDVDAGTSREFPTGIAPYTYSDFTGFALRTFTAPNGFYRTVVEGCAMGPTQWERLEWDAELPARTRVQMRVRSAATTAGLASASWLGPFVVSPSDLTLPPGPVPEQRFLEVEITLVSEDERASPAVRSVTVQFNCPAG